MTRVEITETYTYTIEVNTDDEDEIREIVYDTDSIINRNRDEIDELGTIHTMFEYDIKGV